MNPEDEIIGMVFDWFAIDANGKIALIATAGSGRVPKSVLANVDKHDHLSDELETPHWGTKDVWDDYAMYGLFVFDWELNNGSYRKVAEPKGNLSEELRNKIVSIENIPVLSVDFEKTTILNIEST